MPTDTPNLAFNERKHGSVTNVMRRMARASKKLANKNIRSLHVVVSSEERSKLMTIMEEEGVKAISYGNGVTAREAAIRFKDGEGDALVGTGANFGEGVDLPRTLLRPVFVRPAIHRLTLLGRNSRNAATAIIAGLSGIGELCSPCFKCGAATFAVKMILVLPFSSRRILGCSVFASLPKTLQVSYKGESYARPVCEGSSGVGWINACIYVAYCAVTCSIVR